MKSKDKEEENFIKITILYDNTVYKKGLKSDWGFAALIEFNGKNILFDSGGNGKILLHNMQKLRIDPKIIDTVFMSHNHFDHTGGLSAFLNENNDVKLYVPPSLRGIFNVREREYVNEAQKLYNNIFSTGELDNIEQSLILKIEKGIVIIVGCSHPGISKILETASQFGNPYALIGGFHGFDQFELLKDLDLLCPTHCTKHIKEIKNLYPEKYIEGGVGRVIEI